MQKKQMKISPFSYSLICICVLSACSSEAERKQANRDFNYTSAALTHQLKTPSPLQSPLFSQEYRLPVETRQGLLAEDIDVRPPEQIMPFVSSSRADNNRHNLLLWFSASNLNQQINEDLWSWLNN